MTIYLQPFTLHITGSHPRIHAQLQAAWPRTVLSARRTRAINTITKYIHDALPDDYKGDVSVFVSNEIEDGDIPSQGFVYHLTQQNIVTRQPLRETDSATLLYIHYETALAIDEVECESDDTVPVSRIEQIKQWQKETVKAVFQCMADTGLSMAAQTALRGAMTGLNKLGALLAKASGASTKHVNPVHKQTAQKSASRDIASTLSELRSSLNVASTNGMKPPTKAQLAIRGQLNKLNKIVPPRQKAAPKTQIKTAAISVKAVRAIATAKPAAALNVAAKTVPRVSIIPTRIVARVAHRIALRHIATPATRVMAHATKIIVHKLAARQPIQQRITTPIARASARFHINRHAIIALRTTPILLAKHVALQTPQAIKTITPKALLPLQARHPTQRIARQPAQYSAISKPSVNYRNLQRGASHIGFTPAAVLRVQIKPHHNPINTPSFSAVAVSAAFTDTPSATQATATNAQFGEQQDKPVQKVSLNSEHAAPSIRGSIIPPVGLKTAEILLPPYITAPSALQITQITTPKAINSALSKPTIPPAEGGLPILEKINAVQPAHTIDAIAHSNPNTSLPVSRDSNARSKQIISTSNTSTIQDNAPVKEAPPQREPHKATAKPVERTNIIPLQEFKQDQKEKIRQQDHKNVSSTTTTEIILLRDHLPISRNAGLIKQHQENVYGYKVAVSSGIGTYRNFVGDVAHSYQPPIAASGTTPPSSPPERPKGQKAGQSKLGRVLEGPCG